MNTQRGAKRLRIALLAGASAMMVSAAHAQTAPAAVDEVVVTGSRVITNGNNSPSPVTVATVEQLLAFQPGSVAQALTSLPGLLGSIGSTNSPLSGGIDTVNLRGVGTLRGLRDSDWDRTIAVNLTGVWNTIRATVPYVVERKGYILNTSSQSAIVPLPGMIPYTAAKAGVDNMSRALRMELYPTGTRVGTVYYSWVDTQLVRTTVDSEAGGGLEGMPEFFKKRLSVEDAVEITMDGIEKRAQHEKTRGSCGSS